MIPGRIYQAAGNGNINVFEFSSDATLYYTKVLLLMLVVVGQSAPQLLLVVGHSAPQLAFRY